MARMSDFIIEVGEELNKMKPYLTWDEVIRRVTEQEYDPDIKWLKIKVFNRSYNNNN